VRLEVRADNPAALAFYTRLGFAHTSTMAGYYQGRIDALRLLKPLAAA
jgi:ribosomal protein S18 acetylase RimI-like enzyme